MTLQVFTVRERPELRPVIFGAKFGPAIWPEYMMCDPVASLYYSPPFLDQYLDYVLIGVDGNDVVARGFSVPFAFDIPGREELPDGGWDEVIRWAHQDLSLHRQPTAVSALEISFLSEARGQGNSGRMLEAMKANARVRGFADLFAPVRPRHVAQLRPQGRHGREGAVRGTHQRACREPSRPGGTGRTAACCPAGPSAADRHPASPPAGHRPGR